MAEKGRLQLSKMKMGNNNSCGPHTYAAYLDLPTRTCGQHASSHRRPKKDDPKTAPNLEYDVIYKESSPKNSCYDGSLPKLDWTGLLN